MHNEMTVRGHKIRADENGLICLNDIHKVAGRSRQQEPSRWWSNPSAQGDYFALMKSITGFSGNWAKAEMKSIASSAAPSHYAIVAAAEAWPVTGMTVPDEYSSKITIAHEALGDNSIAAGSA